jgi:hypothetical protein
MVYKALSHVMVPHMRELSSTPTLVSKNKQRLLSEQPTYKDSVRTSQQTHCHRYTDNQLMLFEERVIVCRENDTKHTHTPWTSSGMLKWVVHIVTSGI